jgi:NADPH:quinone reductase-like Zn-dependent oxidoreductase
VNVKDVKAHRDPGTVPSWPFEPGIEAAGTTREAGRVSRFRTGDRVVALIRTG